MKTITIGPSTIKLGRGPNYIIEIRGDNLLSVQRGIGYAHASDRLMQLFIARILSEGRLTEFFIDTREAFAFDYSVRKLGFQDDVSLLTPEACRWVEAYCEGINTYIEQNGTPFICKWLKLEIRPWSVTDIMRIIQLQMYLGLAQVQERLERFIIQAIYDGVSVPRLKELFTPHLSGLDDSLVSLIKKVKLERPYFDEELRFMPGMSNNWALAPSKSASGAPLLCNDPHLQVNRLPAVWYEVKANIGNDFILGATVPGLPGIVIGRSKDLSIGLTYGMMDVIDFFIEDVQDEGKLLSVREEIIKRKKEGEKRLFFYESTAGVIERKEGSQKRLENGYYLALAWSGRKEAASQVLNVFSRLWEQKTVKEAQSLLRQVPFSFNWVLADSQGNIGYQQSGRLPLRKHSGLYPVPAWENEALWKGYVSADQLASEYNPERGFVASANNDHNKPGITLCFAPYRYDRICHILSQKKSFTVEDMKTMQGDLYSLQAEMFMNHIRPLIPPTSIGALLNAWDLRYNKESKGAVLFEAFYKAILEEVFGKIFGKEAWEYLSSRHSLLLFTHGQLDRILLEGDEMNWFGKEGRRECFRRILRGVLARFSAEVPTWGEASRFRLFHMIFEGKVPPSLGKGPYPLEGCRATLAASHFFQEHTLPIAVAASYRFITDIGQPEAYTALCGGVTEGRFSRHYTSDLSLWLAFKYKRTKLDFQQKI